jgi:hypothetical protein
VADDSEGLIFWLCFVKPVSCPLTGFSYCQCQSLLEQRQLVKFLVGVDKKKQMGYSGTAWCVQFHVQDNWRI